MNKKEFTVLEQYILALAGDDLPDGLTPFVEIAKTTGTDEDTVVMLLRSLKDQGIIRRFGATLRHQKAGWSHNSMVAWRVDDGNAMAVGKAMAKHPQISHCYLRRTYPEWPYNLYTMIHGRYPGECDYVAEGLSRDSGIIDYQMVYSISELKKTSMHYFLTEKKE